MLLTKTLSKYCTDIRAPGLPISKGRIEILNELTAYILSQQYENKTPALNFICTHNSRRSQFAQIWAFTAAAFYNVPVQCYSGGTEATAFNEKAVEAVINAGFIVERSGNSNPLYQVRYAEDAAPLIMFSKVHDHANNPKENFAAVMTCSEADTNCPFIPGAEKRIPLTYEDPKLFDNTPQEKSKYNERCLQIASEMFYVFKNVKNQK